MSFQQDKPLFEACLFVAEVDRAERTNPDVGEEETSATTLPEDKKARKRYMPCRKCPMVVPRSEEGSVCLTYGATKVFWLCLLARVIEVMPNRRVVVEDLGSKSGLMKVK